MSMRVRNALFPAVWFVAGVAVAVLVGRLVTPPWPRKSRRGAARRRGGGREGRVRGLRYAARVRHRANGRGHALPVVAPLGGGGGGGGRRPAAYAAHLDRMKKLAGWCGGVVKLGEPAVRVVRHGVLRRRGGAPLGRRQMTPNPALHLTRPACSLLEIHSPPTGPGRRACCSAQEVEDLCMRTRHLLLIVAASAVATLCA